MVFDGYNKQQTTKDHEHARRCRTKCHNFSIQKDTILTVSQQSFLSNGHNKMELLKLLVPELVEDGHNVSQATADADRMIVSTALATASMGKTNSLRK